jgi:hypothetical protein
MKKSILILGIIGAFITLLALFLPKAKPTDVVVMWKTGLYNANYDLVEKHTSATSVDYIKNKGGIAGIIKSYQDNADKEGRGLIEIISHSINADKAIVNYKSYYRKTGATIFFQDTLFLEDELWKVAPQFVIKTK